MSILQPTYYVRHPDNTYSVADPQPTIQLVKQEPVAFMFKVKRTTAASTVLDEFAAIDYFPQDNEEIVSKEPLLYAAPVERQWVDLTDDEIAQEFCLDDYDYARAVIAAFKGKNK